MIAKQIKGTNFYGCIDYVLKKPDRIIVDSNVSGTKPIELAAQFQLHCQRNPRVTRPVYHAVLSTHEDEKPDPSTWKAIASDFLRHMKFTNVPYLVVEHNDRDHHHIHIVAARVRANGTCVRDSWDYLKGQKAVRFLEKKYGLTSPDDEEKYKQRYTLRNTKPIQLNDYQPKKEDFEAYNLIKETIDMAYPHCHSLVELATMLKQQGIELKIRKTKRTNTVQGIRYRIGDFHFSGTQLGKNYTLPGLSYKSQRSHQLTFDPHTDLALIESLKHSQLVLEQEANKMVKQEQKTRSRRR